MIGLSLISMTPQLEHKSKLKIYGYWEYEKVKYEGIEKSASNLNQCGHNDILQIRRSNEKVSYEFNDLEISGNRIGISNRQICAISPIVHRYVVANNSCPTEWIKISNSENRIVSINEGLVIEYEIKKPSRKKMILVKIREIVNNGISIPHEIQLKKIKRN